MNHANADTDALLTAYIDGELAGAERIELERTLAEDAGLRERLRILEAGQRPFAKALEPLLDMAPVGKLEAMLATLPQPAAPDLGRARPARAWRLMPVAAAAAAAFAAGLLSAELAPTTFGLAPPSSGEHEADPSHWRQVVAEYQTLYTPEAVASMPDDEQAKRKELAAVGAELGLNLSPEAASFPDLELKRAQLYGYEGQALGQLTYLDRNGRPVALCIVKGQAAAEPMRSETREGMPIVYWSREGRSFMLIGTVPDAELRTLARKVSERL